LKALRREFWAEAEKQLSTLDVEEMKNKACTRFKEALAALQGTQEAVVPEGFEIPAFISETDLPLWENKIAEAVRSGTTSFRCGSLHALSLLEKYTNLSLAGIFPLSITNSQCAALLKEQGFSSAAVSPELPEKTFPALLEHSPLPLFHDKSPVPLLVSRTVLKPEGLWKERSGMKLLLAFDSEEKLWKLWKK
jgi:hypothetical protein